MPYSSLFFLNFFYYRFYCNLKVIPKSNGLNIIEIEKINIKEKRYLPSIKSERKAMILYTSGTTSKPKGVVTTHMNVESQLSLIHI